MHYDDADVYDLSTTTQHRDEGGDQDKHHNYYHGKVTLTSRELLSDNYRTRAGNDRDNNANRQNNDDQREGNRRGTRRGKGKTSKKSNSSRSARGNR